MTDIRDLAVTLAEAYLDWLDHPVRESRRRVNDAIAAYSRERTRLRVEARRPAPARPLPPPLPPGSIRGHITADVAEAGARKAERRRVSARLGRLPR